MKKGYIHSIESFGTVDGPGTRMVVFFQGCNLRCKYCHNPDTWKIAKDTKQMSVLEILDKYEKIKEFITGGITISGGEPLLQAEFLLEFLKEAKKRGIHTCVDTSGGVFNTNNKHQQELFEELFNYVDLVLLDIKHIDSEENRKLVGIKNENILKFAKYLSKRGIDVWIRHVLVPTITLNDKYLYKIGMFLATLDNVKGVEVLPYHTMALPKYESLGYDYPLKGIEAATKEEAQRARKIILLAMKQTKDKQN